MPADPAGRSPASASRSRSSGDDRVDARSRSGATLLLVDEAEHWAEGKAAVELPAAAAARSLDPAAASRGANIFGAPNFDAQF
jgi:hypothetical protein